jgi:hydroxymethylglutaryl-CoA lyase
MGFGNPYGEAYSPEITAAWAERMIGLGFRYISLSDTVGAADPAHVSQLFGALIPRYPEVVFGAHFHSVPGAWREKVDAALEAGCRRFDGAIKGFGGCPFAADALTGNLPTELLVDYFEREGWQTGTDREALARAVAFAPEVFGG